MSTVLKNSEPQPDPLQGCNSKNTQSLHGSHCRKPGKRREAEDPDSRAAAAVYITDKLASVGHLAAGIAHELRNPLSTIAASLYYLSKVLGSQDNQSVQDHLTIMQCEIERTQNIIANLVDFSRRSTNDREKVDVNEVLEQTLSLLKRNLDSQEIEAQMNLASIPLCFVSVDDLKQAFLHLFVNAIDAMPDGGRLTIATFSHDENTVGIRIADDGIGIDPERLELIFNPFYSTKMESKMGLGLALVHACIERNHGAITVKSTAAVGSEFTIALPIYSEGANGG